MERYRARLKAKKHGEEVGEENAIRIKKKGTFENNKKF